MAEKNQAEIGIGAPVIKIAVVIVVMLLVIVGAGYAISYYLERGQNQTVSADIVPIIRADKSPLKKKPVDAGGLKVPFKDKLIYERIKPNGTVEIGERLLPPPEKPIEKPKQQPVAEVQPPEPKPLDKDVVAEAEKAGGTETSSEENPEVKLEKQTTDGAKSETIPLEPSESTGEKTETVPDSAIAKLAARLEEEEKAAAKKAEEQKITTESTETTVKAETLSPAPAEPVPAPKTAPEVATTPEPKMTPEAEVSVQVPPIPRSKPAKNQATKATPSTAASGNFRVQLAAFRNKAAADSAWAAMQKKHSKLLGTRSHIVVKIDLGKKGVFHRLQAGPIKTRAEADKLCAALKARKQGCLPVTVK